MKPFAFFDRTTGSLRFETLRDLRNARIGEQREIPLYTEAQKEEDRMKERSADFARRVEVEQYLLDVSKGKKPAPNKAKCKELAHQLGIPDEYRSN